MYKIIDDKGTGKTSRLMLLAKENGGVIVCANPTKMIEKAHFYGISGIEFLSYQEYISLYKLNSIKQPVFIDELDSFLKNFDPNIVGYNLSTN